MALDKRKVVLNAVNQANQIITPRYERWLMKGESLPYPDWVVDRIAEVLSQRPRVRSNSFSASSSGSCARAQMFGFIGTPSGDVLDPRLGAIFNNGLWTHLRLQAAMLTLGIVNDIEFPLKWKRKRTMGTVDAVGIVPDNHMREDWRGKWFGVELKTRISFGFEQIKENGPEYYEQQFSRYKNMAGFDLFVLFVENKNTQDHIEWVYEPDALDKNIVEDNKELFFLNRSVETEQLPDRLQECSTFKGKTFINCPYGGRFGPCKRIDNWKEAVREALTEKV